MNCDGNCTTEVDDWVPNWDDLPDWVEWVAQNSDGTGYGYKDRPILSLDCGVWVNSSPGFHYINRSFRHPDSWQNTLTKRPEKPSKRTSLEGKVNVSIGKPSCINDILSEDEIDALLSGVTQDDEPCTETISQQSTQSHYETKTGTDFIQRFSDVHSEERVRGALLFSIGKYCERYGQKDDTLKEAKKIADYANRLLKFEQQLEEYNYE